MELKQYTLPPVSQKFYESVIKAFPPLDPLDIKEGTTQIHIHRKAAQEEVIQFIKSAVRKTDEQNKVSLWSKFKRLIN